MIFKKWLIENKTKSMWKDVPYRARVLFSAECAEKVLHIFEKEFPQDTNPGKAIQAAFDFGLNGIPINRNEFFQTRITNYEDAETDEELESMRRVPPIGMSYKKTSYNTPAQHAIIAAMNSLSGIDNVAVSSRALGIKIFKRFNSLKQKVIGPNIDFSPKWKTSTTIGISQQIWYSRTIGNLPILADALMDVGVDDNLVNYMIRDQEQTLADWFLWNLNLGHL